MANRHADGRLVALRLTSQLLGGPRATTADAVVERLLAVQAQDARAFRLSVRSRSSGPRATDVDRALTDGDLIVTWLNRGTLHLVRADDYWWLHPLTTPQLRTGNRTRLAQEGVSEAQAERGVDLIAGALTHDGPLTRDQLRIRLDAAGVPTAGQAVVHLLVAASIRGLIVRGPMVDGHHAFAAVPSWLGAAPAPLDRDEALGRLARRYLAGHGPASARDLAKWAGITLGDARHAFGALGDAITPFADDVVVLVGRDDAAPLPPPTLLGGFDPILCGWSSREEFVGAHRGVVTVNGLFRPVALVDGRVVATWAMPDRVVTITALEPFSAKVRQALTRDAVDVVRFLDLPDRPAVFTTDA
jgi:hypothetical protein